MSTKAWENLAFSYEVGFVRNTASPQSIEAAVLLMNECCALCDYHGNIILSVS